MCMELNSHPSYCCSPSYLKLLEWENFIQKLSPTKCENITMIISILSATLFFDLESSSLICTSYIVVIQYLPSHPYTTSHRIFPKWPNWTMLYLYLHIKHKKEISNLSVKFVLKRLISMEVWSNKFPLPNVMLTG